MISGVLSNDTQVAITVPPNRGADGAGMAAGVCSWTESRRTPSRPARPSNRLTFQGFRRLAEQLHAFLMLQASVRAAAKVTNTPARKRQYDDAKLSSSICQRVSRSGGMVGIELSIHQAMGLESLEAARQHIGGDPGKTLLKILESHAAGKQVPNDEQCPPRANNLERSGNGARLAQLGFCHIRASSSNVASYLQTNSIYISRYRSARKRHSCHRNAVLDSLSQARDCACTYECACTHPERRLPFEPATLPGGQTSEDPSGIRFRCIQIIDDRHHIAEANTELYLAPGAGRVSSKTEHK